MSENQQNKTLALFREQIDEIDLKILNLLKDRMVVIKNVGDLKKSYNEKFYIRSNREADMIKNLVNLAENKFPIILLVKLVYEPDQKSIYRNCCSPIIVCIVLFFQSITVKFCSN